MKLTKFKYMVAGCGFAVTLLTVFGCSKKLEKTIQEDFDFTNKANVQLYNAIVGSNRTYLYVDNKPVNGAAIAYGASFPANAYAFAVTGGPNAFLLRDTLATSTQQPISFAENFQPGRHYTIFAYDTSTAAKQITIESNILIPSDSTARLRFANFAFSRDVALPAVDVFSVRRGQNIFTGISQTQVTDFIPFASARNDTLIVRYTGTATNVAVLNGINPVQKRSYTVVLRGGLSKVLTTFANR